MLSSLVEIVKTTVHFLQCMHACTGSNNNTLKHLCNWGNVTNPFFKWWPIYYVIYVSMHANTSVYIIPLQCLTQYSNCYTGDSIGDKNCSIIPLHTGMVVDWLQSQLPLMQLSGNQPLPLSHTHITARCMLNVQSFMKDHGCGKIQSTYFHTISWLSFSICAIWEEANWLLIQNTSLKPNI